MEKLLEYILKRIVKKPEKVDIKREEENNEVRFLIQIDDDDKGRIIGKNGTNIKSIRLILSILARRENKKVFLKVE